MNRPIDDAADPGFAPPRVEKIPRAGGGFVLRSPIPLAPYARCVGEWLAQWAKRAPTRTFLAERSAGAWRVVTYAEALSAARRIGAALIERGLSDEQPLVILSDNSVDHALLAIAAQFVGVPYAPISPAYSLLSSDHAKLRAIFALLQPGLVYADDGAKFARALAAVGNGYEFTASRNVPPGATPFARLATGNVAAARVDAAAAAVTPDSIAKILFTSGSTGEPKGVINTHRMLTSNQQMIRQCWPFLECAPPVIVDWLPWNHTFGGNHNFNMVLANGGSLYIDEGKPVPGLIEKTVANLRDVAPNLYFNVPRGFDGLLPYLESDAALARRFFAQLKLIFYAGAALPQNLWERLERAAAQLGKRVAMVSSWGSTETAPMVTSVHFPIDRAGVIGIPAPGCEVLMLPSGDRLEMRVRGPNVTPGYFKRPDLSAEAFDPEGFYRIGDAGRLADPADAAAGVIFDGRIAENFKLASGTWVHVGTLRVRAIAALAPVAQDVVVTGHDRDEVGLLVFANPAGCASLCPEMPKDSPLAVLAADARVRERVAQGLRALAAEAAGSSERVTRALLLSEPPSIDANEITDKGYINQRAVLMRRAAAVNDLYRTTAPPEVVTLDH
ncbi:MAG TPA: feruloyl-CoA synthase [Burkholderiaceae bacterium]|nr:feruloyl-CoA synthase [Burkholderiaceae bacterium]